MAGENIPKAPLEKARPMPEDMNKRGIDALRSANRGWQEIRNGNKESRRERLLREQTERARAIKRGEDPDSENNWKPGDDDTYYQSGEAPSLRNLRENHKRMQKENAQKRFFEGPSEMVVLKLVQLFENAKKSKPEIVSVEESGFNTYKVTYISE